jgi:hypothetical protein
VIAAIASAMGFDPAPRSYLDLVAALDASRPTEIVVDEIDGAADDAVMLLASIYRDVAEPTRFVYLARSETAIPIAKAQAEGVLDLGDGGLLAFTPHEIAAYVGALDLEPDQIAPDELFDAAHGWAYAVTGACRTAAGTRLRTQAALTTWRRDHRSALDAMVADALALAPEPLARAFTERRERGVRADAETLAAFKRHGLFVVEHRGRLMLNPLIDRGACETVATVAPAPAVLGEIELFGPFALRIDGNAVKWKRLRDRNLIQFLALRKNGKATRDELAAIFWPDVDRQLAAQSLRTALSTIRSAFAACVGAQRAADYFVAGPIVELRVDAFLVSAMQFDTQFDLGGRAEARGAFAVAFRHYRTAAAIYRAPLLEEEGEMPWLRAARDAYAEAFERLGARIDWLRASVATLDADLAAETAALVRETAGDGREEAAHDRAERGDRSEARRRDQKHDDRIFDEGRTSVVREERS